MEPSRKATRSRSLFSSARVKALVRAQVLLITRNPDTSDPSHWRFVTLQGQREDLESECLRGQQTGRWRPQTATARAQAQTKMFFWGKRATRSISAPQMQNARGVRHPKEGKAGIQKHVKTYKEARKKMKEILKSRRPYYPLVAMPPGDLAGG